MHKTIVKSHITRGIQYLSIACSLIIPEHTDQQPMLLNFVIFLFFLFKDGTGILTMYCENKYTFTFWNFSFLLISNHTHFPFLLINALKLKTVCLNSEPPFYILAFRILCKAFCNLIFIFLSRFSCMFHNNLKLEIHSQYVIKSVPQPFFNIPFISKNL